MRLQQSPEKAHGKPLGLQSMPALGHTPDSGHAEALQQLTVAPQGSLLIAQPHMCGPPSIQL